MTYITWLRRADAQFAPVHVIQHRHRENDLLVLTSTDGRTLGGFAVVHIDDTPARFEPFAVDAKELTSALIANTFVVRGSEMTSCRPFVHGGTEGHVFLRTTDKGQLEVGLATNLANQIACELDTIAGGLR